jgi:hypothetical protein
MRQRVEGRDGGVAGFACTKGPEGHFGTQK